MTSDTHASEDPSALFAVAIDLHRRRREAEAEPLYRRLLTLVPDHPEVQNLLGAALLAMSRAAEAVPLLSAAASADPGRGDFQTNLASAHLGSGNLSAAIGSARRGLALAPDIPDAWFTLGNGCRKLRRHDESIGFYRRGLTLNPQDAQAQSELGGVLYESGLPDAALAAYRRSLALSFEPAAHSGYIYLLEFDRAMSPQDHQRERRRWAAAYPRRSDHPKPALRDPDPERPLTIGLLAPSFDTGNSLLVEPFFTARRREAFRCIAYSNLGPADEMARRLAVLADGWRAIGGLTDEAAAETIRSDRVDILVDTANHIGGHRLGVFTLRPAPIQMSGWSHGLGTGLREVDYLVADPVSIPPEERHLYVETVVDVTCRAAFPPPRASPPVAPLPVARGRPFSFGHLGRLAKVTDDVLRLWATLLRATPGTRLVLKSGGHLAMSRVIDAMAGIGQERLVFLGPKNRFENMADYAELDLSLDTSPVSGPLTLWEALWMGVPTLALPGNTQSARATASILKAADLSEFVMASEEQFIATAQALVRDPSPLLALRASLRDRVAASPAANVLTTAREMERVFRMAWRKACTDSASVRD